MFTFGSFSRRYIDDGDDDEFVNERYIDDDDGASIRQEDKILV